MLNIQGTNRRRHVAPYWPHWQQQSGRWAEWRLSWKTCHLLPPPGRQPGAGQARWRRLCSGWSSRRSAGSAGTPSPSSSARSSRASGPRTALSWPSLFSPCLTRTEHLQSTCAIRRSTRRVRDRGGGGPGAPTPTPSGDSPSEHPPLRLKGEGGGRSSRTQNNHNNHSKIPLRPATIKPFY